MSLLQDPSRSDAALGEEITKGSGHLIVATVIAVVVVSIAIAWYVIAGQKPPAATGQVISVVVHPMHRETSGFDASGAVMPKEEFDQVLVFTHFKMHDESKNPLFLRRITTNVTMADGSIRSSYASSATDYKRLFQAYPDLNPLSGTPVDLDATIQPGGTLEGDFVCSFRMSQQEFDSRKGLTYNIGLRYLPDLVLTPTVSVVAH
ncbi:MAG: hypothetical protein ACLGSD_19530 [Acidobacteriota bacterium]